MTFVSARHCSEKGAEKLPKIEDNGQRLLKKSVQETQQQQHTLGKELKSKENIVDLGHEKPRARNTENLVSNTTRQRKGQAKKLHQKKDFILSLVLDVCCFL